MKNIFTKYLLLTLLAATTISCNDWLSVTSSSELQADKLFETRVGFHEALTGVYMTMGGNHTYGGSYMWSVNNYAAFPYSINSQLIISEVQKHQYTLEGVKSEINAMWYNGYNIIANINIILRELEKRRDVVTSDIEYNLISGELHALRALVHFDLMRMFGVNDWSGANASKLTIPYIKEYSAQVTPQLSYAETEKLLLSDLNVALEALKSTDPILGEPSESFGSTINADDYWTNRTKHMNYYAVVALAARIYQWKHDYAKAAEYANEVIEGAFSSGLVFWVDPAAIVKESSEDNKDWIFSSEHVFSLDVTGLYSTLRHMFFSGDRVSLYIDDSFVSVIYPDVDEYGTVSGIEDIRGKALHLKYTNLGYVLYKYYGSTNFAHAYRNRIPMTRISEMYYIVAENHVKNGENAEALKMLDIVREHRGITTELLPEMDAEKELLKEYYREFVGEDKLFYYLKHINAEKSLSETFDLTASGLIYPYPDGEINYGRKQEL